ncbi:putative Rossmann fold nucleotide-binding protein [Synechococcus sp. PCC 7502]|uniref:LOG family protein n=1 Tax=Synechococcus sp. PCC 7502 TaxID=1173263 RepID=UPI00029F908D|nr:LOG family protein [Synechococcus sp. PCC 7502]AFY74952.1 putative Rossmann fold nucleotide-binding protein [Synechococcus sp. PCC 7502]
MSILPSQDFNHLKQDLDRLLGNLPDHPHSKLIYRALNLIVQLSQTESDRLDWKLVSGTLQDMYKALEMFHPYRHIRKVSIFGSARIASNTPEYIQAQEFAQQITKAGFMVLTGGGGGIMAAGNEGAGKDHSFGLNIYLPFEQEQNLNILDSHNVNFKYFFTRKLFFLRETSAIAIFPGGFGTQDELFESLTLLQTGKSTPKPIILMDKPDGCYWQEWDSYMQTCLQGRKLINPEDHSLYTITSDITAAVAKIANFYKVYHSSRWVKDIFVIRLNQDISDAKLQKLNDLFSDRLIDGEIKRSKALEPEKKDGDIYIDSLPRLIMRFTDHHNYGYLQQLIWAINDE